MKKTLTFLAASTALTVAIGVPAWSAMQAPSDGVLRPVAALFDDAAQAMPLVLASDDDDDDNRWRDGSRRGHDDETMTTMTKTATTMMTTTNAAVALAIPRPRARSPLRRTASSGTAHLRRFR